MATAENNLRSDMLFPVFIRRKANIFLEHPRKMCGRRKREIVPDGSGAAVGIAEEAFGLLRFLLENKVIELDAGLAVKFRGQIRAAHIQRLGKLLRGDRLGQMVLNVIGDRHGKLSRLPAQMLALSGYVAPISAKSVSEASSRLAASGLTPQLALESLKPAADGVLTVAVQQSASVNNAITFSFVGLEVFTGIILAVILLFVDVEKRIGKEQEEIKARRETK